MLIPPLPAIRIAQVDFRRVTMAGIQARTCADSAFVEVGPHLGLIKLMRKRCQQAGVAYELVQVTDAQLANVMDY